MKEFARRKTTEFNVEYYWGEVKKRYRNKYGVKVITIAYTNRMWYQQYIPEETLFESECDIKTVWHKDEYIFMALCVLFAAAMIYLFWLSVNI